VDRCVINLFTSHTLTPMCSVTPISIFYFTIDNFSSSLDDIYRGDDKSLARPTSRYILFDGQNISFDVSLVIYINGTNIPPIMIINRIYQHQNFLSL
jgi:hypothetical protein